MAGMFYQQGLSENDASLVLEGDEARHAVSARRLRVGEAVSITNGRGLVGFGEVVEVQSRPARLTLSLQRFEQFPRTGTIHVAAALPKGERQRVMLEMSTQAGMSCFTPLICERSVSKEGANARERWHRICLEAMKQSRRAWLPEIKPAARIKDFLDSLPADSLILLTSADGDGPRKLAGRHAGSNIVVLVGPEGGFSEDEVGLVRRAGALEVSLGDGILRTETAVVVATAMASSLLLDQ